MHNSAERNWFVGPWQIEWLTIFTAILVEVKINSPDGIIYFPVVIYR
jgi:hypothetical protein